MENNKFFKRSLPILLVMMILMSTVTSFAGSVILEEEIIEEEVEEVIEDNNNEEVIEEEVDEVEPVLETYSVGNVEETPAEYFDTYNVRRGEISIKGFKRGKFTENLIIPEVINGRKVTEVASSAFRYENIKTLVLPKTIYRVHGYAFANTNIERVVLNGDNMDYVQPYSFAYIDGLKEVVVDGNINKIGGYAFTKNPNLENFLVTEDANIKTINDYAFARNNNLESIQILGEVGRIRTYTFAYNPKLVLVEIHGKVDRILGYAFAYNNNLGYVDIAGEIDQINDYAFAYNGKGIADSGGVVVPSPEPVEVAIRYQDQDGNKLSDLDHSIMATPTLEHKIYADEEAVIEKGYYLTGKSSINKEVDRFEENEVVFNVVREPESEELTKYTIRHVAKDEKGNYYDILDRRVGEGKINVEEGRHQGVRIHAKEEDINGYEFLDVKGRNFTILSKNSPNIITFEYEQVDENPNIVDDFKYTTYYEKSMLQSGHELADPIAYDKSIPGTTIYDMGKSLNIQNVLLTAERPVKTEVVENPEEGENEVVFTYTNSTGNPDRFNYVIRIVGENKYGELVDFEEPRDNNNYATTVYYQADETYMFEGEEYELVSNEGKPNHMFQIQSGQINVFHIRYELVNKEEIPEEEIIVPEIDEDDYIEDEVTIYHGMLNISGNIRQMRPYTFAYGDFQEVSITGKINEIMSYAFKENGLNNLEISDDIDTIRSYAFAYNDLEEVRIPEKVSRIQTYAFSYNNIKTLNYSKLSDSRVRLAHNMFRHQKTGNNIKVFVPVGVEYNGNDALISNLLRHNNISEVVFEE